MRNLLLDAVFVLWLSYFVLTGNFIPTDLIGRPEPATVVASEDLHDPAPIQLHDSQIDDEA